MKFNEYYGLDEKAKQSGVYGNTLQNAKEYTDERIKELERKITGSSRGDGDIAPKYTVVPSQSVEGDVLIIIDIEEGTMEGRLAARGRLISHPLVYGNKVAFAIQRPNKDKIGAIHSLPDGQLVNQFRITGEETEGTEISPIFRREEDLVKSVGDVFPAIMSAWIEDQNSDEADIAALRELIQPDSDKAPAPAPVPVPGQSYPGVSSPDMSSPITQVATPTAPGRLPPGSPVAPYPTYRAATGSAGSAGNAGNAGSPGARAVSNRAARIARLRARKHFFA